MRYYNFLRKLIAAIVLLYFIVGNATWGLLRLEIFPIYSWELFSTVPNLVTDYGLKISAINQVPLDPPVYFQDLPDEFAEAQSIVAFYVIQQFGNAIEENDVQAIQDLRNQIESNYFSNQTHVEYEIEKRSYDAKDRWDTGRYEETRRLRSYAKSDK